MRALFRVLMYVSHFMPLSTVDSLLHPAPAAPAPAPAVGSASSTSRANAIPRRWLRAVMTLASDRAEHRAARALSSRYLATFYPGFTLNPRRSTEEHQPTAAPPWPARPRRTQTTHAPREAMLCRAHALPCAPASCDGSERVWRSAPGACHCLQAAAVNHERGHRRCAVIHC